MSFESDKQFNDFQHFARGIRRSGEFSIRESGILEKCGTAMMELHMGTREPADETEKVFLEQLHSDEVITDANAKRWVAAILAAVPTILLSINSYR